MPTSSPHAKQPKALALKQAANWQCKACGKLCRRPNESLGDFAVRSGHEAEVIAAHPRRWTLHVTKNYKPESIVLDPDNAKKKAPKKKTKKSSNQSVVVLCGSCHRTYHNYRRWQRHQQKHHQQQEHMGQLTLSDIRPPLTGLQLSLNDWGTPYEIVNPQSPRRRLKAPKATSDFN